MTELNAVSEEDTMAKAYDLSMGIEQPTDDAPDEVSTDVEEGLTGPEDVDTQTESVEPPASWTADAKERFSQLPKETQEYIAEREAQREKAINQAKAELAEVKRSSSGIETVTQKHGQYLQELGLTPEVAFDTLLTAEHTLRNGTLQQKMGVIQQIAQDYGIPLQGGNPDALVSQLSQELNTVKSTLQSLTEGQRTAQQQEHLKTIENFATAKDDKGIVLRPHFEEVRETMSKLMLGGVAETLEDAYTKAIHIVPEVKAKIEAEAKKAQEKASIERAKKAKTEASTKSSGLPKSMVGVSETVEDTMSRIYDEIAGT